MPTQSGLHGQGLDGRVVEGRGGGGEQRAVAPPEGGAMGGVSAARLLPYATPGPTMWKPEPGRVASSA